MAASVDPKCDYIQIKLQEKQPVAAQFKWVKGLKLNYKSNLIITWGWYKVSMNHLSHQGGLISQFKNLVDREEKILDVLVFSDYRYFVTSTTLGNIYVFKYITQG